MMCKQTHRHNYTLHYTYSLLILHIKFHVAPFRAHCAEVARTTQEVSAGLVYGEGPSFTSIKTDYKPIIS